MNKFLYHLKNSPAVLMDAPMETRIEYGTDIKLDPEMSIFTLADKVDGKAALAALYRQDIDTVMPFNLPIILNAPAFRASREHCQRLGLPTSDEYILQINQACLDLIAEVQREYGDYADNIILTVPIGPKYAGFTPDQITDLEAEVDYHSQQINAVARMRADFISIPVMPGGFEAIGAAIAASKQSLPYTAGFAMNSEGCLLDGTPVREVIDRIETETVSHPPVGYFIGCTHPSIAAQGLSDDFPEYHKIIGIKANGSSMSPKELLKLDKPVADAPAQFADELLALGRPRGFKIYSGCCGTDSDHLRALAERLSSD